MEFIDLETLGPQEDLPDHSLYSQTQFTPNGRRLITMIHSTANYLCNLTCSDGYIVYMFDEAYNELYICPPDMIDKNTSICVCKWNIDRDQTIAIHVFKYRTPIIVDAYTSVDLNFPYLQDIPGMNPRNILSLPLVNFNRRCFGVVEYYRAEGRQYHERDVNLCQFLLKNCAEALKQNESAVFFIKYNKIQVRLQHQLEKYAYGKFKDGSYRFLGEVVKMARSCTRALSASVFFEKKNSSVEVVDNEVEEEYRTNTLYEIKVVVRTEITAPFDAIAMNCPRHGVLKVFNKFGVIKFLKYDEQILKSFVEMMKVWCIMEYMSGYVKKQETLNNNILGLICLLLRTPGEASKKLTSVTPSEMEKLNSWTYTLETNVSEKHLASDIFTMFNNMNNNLPISDEALKCFIVMIGQCHSNDKDSNFRVTVLCVQCLYKLFLDCKNLASDLEVFGMLIAALSRRIHLVDENAFKSATFGRYNNHATKLIRFEIIKFFLAETQLLSELSGEDQKKLLNMIMTYMMDTTLETFKENTLKLHRMTRTQCITMSNLSENPELRNLVMSVIPGLGNSLGQFRLQEFIKIFPDFDLFHELEKRKGTCIDTFLLVNSM